MIVANSDCHLIVCAHTHIFGRVKKCANTQLNGCFAIRLCKRHYATVSFSDFSLDFTNEESHLFGLNFRRIKMVYISTAKKQSNKADHLTTIQLYEKSVCAV